MRQITQESINAFLRGDKFNKQNMTVCRDNGGDNVLLKLHGNTIAKRGPNGLFITLAGWPSVTTRERLTGLLNKLNVGYVAQRKGLQYLGFWSDSVANYSAQYAGDEFANTNDFELEIDEDKWYQIQ